MRRLKESVIYGLYAIGSLSVIGGLFAYQAIKNTDEYINTRYVTKNIFEESYPVINITKSFERPYTEQSVTIFKSFYNPESEDNNNAIIYYENTYMPSTGTIYKSSNEFNVLSIYEGEVISVEENNITGKVITIKHNENTLSIYQGINNPLVEAGDVVNTGQSIATSGTNNLTKETNQLHVELIINGQNRNPEECYGKTLEELNK